MTAKTLLSTLFLTIIFCFSAKAQFGGGGGFSSPPDAPVIYANSNPVCYGSNVVFQVQGKSCGGSSSFNYAIRWYSTYSSTIALSTGNCYTVNNLTSSKTIYAEAHDLGTGLKSNRVSYTVSVVSNATPSASNNSRCGNGQIDLNVNSPSGTYRWYTSSGTRISSSSVNGHQLLNNGATLRITNLTSTTTYSVAKYSNGCESGRRSVTATRYVLPSAPTFTYSNGSSFCGSGSTTVYPSSSGSISQYRWHTTSSTSSPHTTGNSKSISVSNGASKSYWVRAKSSQGCWGPMQKVTVTSNALPSSPSFTYSNGSSFCGSGSTTVYPSSSGSISQYRWHTTSSTSSPHTTGNSKSISVSNGSSKSYWVRAKTSQGCWGPLKKVTVNSKFAPAAPSFTFSNGNTFNGAGSTTVYASSPGSISQYRWHTTSSTSSSYSNGNSKSISLGNGESKSFWVRALSSDGCWGSLKKVTISSTPSAPADPVIMVSSNPICYNDNVTYQIQGKSCGAGNSLDYTIRWYNSSHALVKTGNCYSVSNLTSDKLVYAEAYDTSTGLTSNKISYTVNVESNSPPAANDNSRCGNGQIDLNVNSPSGTYRWYTSSGTRISSTSVDGHQLLNNGATLRITNLTSTTTYSVAKYSNGCESNRKTVTATRYAFPSAPTFTYSNGSSFCGSGSTIVTPNAAGAEAYRWHTTSSPSSPYTTGNSKSISLSNGESKSYWVRAKNAQGCWGPLQKVTVSSTALPTKPSVTNIIECNSTISSPSIDGYETNVLEPEFLWYSDSQLNNFIGRGSILPQREINETTTFYVIEKGQNGCDSEPAQLTVEIRSPYMPPEVSNDDFEHCGPATNVEFNIVNPDGDYIWYNGEGDEIDPESFEPYQILNESTTLRVNTLDKTSDFSVVKVGQYCNGLPKQFTATIHDIPDQPDISSSEGLSFCGNVSTILTADSQESGIDDYRWYDSAGETLNIGESYEASIGEGESKTFTVRAISSSGCLGLPKSITLNSSLLSEAPDVSNIVLCEAGTVNLSVNNVEPNTIDPMYKWYLNYDSPEQRELVGQGAVLKDITVDTDTQYYVIAEYSDGTCFSNPGVLSVDINDDEIQNLEVDIFRCRNIIELSISDFDGTANYYWLDDQDEIIESDLQNGWLLSEDKSSLKIYGLDDEMNIKISKESEFGCRQEFSSHLLTPTVEFDPVVRGEAYFGETASGSISIVADRCLTGYNWYDSPTSTEVLATNYVLNLYNIKNSHTYYVATTFTNNVVSNKVPVEVIVYPKAEILNLSGDNIIESEEQIVITSNENYEEYQWYKDGEIIEGENSKQLTVESPGDYGLKVTVTEPIIKSSFTDRLSIIDKNETQEYNYIEEKNIKTADVKDENEVFNLSTEDFAHSITYFSDFGKLLQKNNIKASPNGQDLISTVKYDEFGRKFIDYLPYTANIDGVFDENSIKSAEGDYQGSNQHNFYANASSDLIANTSVPYAETVYENSPLNRPIAQYAPGEDWAKEGGDHPVSTDYLISSATDEVIRFAVDGNALQIDGEYGDGAFQKTVVTDENGNQSATFTDAFDKTLLKRNIADGKNFDTYYVYDIYDNLRFVIPPEAIHQLTQNSGQFPSGLLADFVYEYRFDGKNRKIWEKIPGKEPHIMIYDDRDRLVLTQDGEQAKENLFSFTKFDALNRPIMTGEKVINDSIPNLRDLLSGEDWLQSYAAYETLEGDKFGYTSNSLPKNLDLDEIHTVTYYDHYNFRNEISLDGVEYDYEGSGMNNAFEQTNFVKGQITGSLTRVLGTNEMLASVNYYDERYQLLQNISKQKDGKLITSNNSYDFVGNVLESNTHFDLGDEIYTLKENFTYDHANRLLTVTHQVNQEEPVLMVSNEYNELGELITKNLHQETSSFGGTQGGFAQSVDYRYNIRGWLTRINHADLSADNANEVPDLFGMDLGYTDDFNMGSDLQFNGNIAAIKWSANLGMGENLAVHGINVVNQRAYGFDYDALNRILGATSFERMTVFDQSPNFSMNISAYDFNGNILRLTRKDATGADMDSLEYFYGNSNQLQWVKDHSSNEKGFKDGNTDGTDYVYDDNGNMITDANKKIDSISYNHLNLPDTVVFEDGKRLVYVYDATGTKLQQQTITGDTVKITDYLGALYLENDTLQFIQTAEGRVVPKRSDWEYQYYMKDHLGNVRTTFTSEPKTETYSSSFEFAIVPDGYFDNYEDQHRDDYTAKTGIYSSRLSYDDNLLIGLAKSLKVYPGDTVKAKAYAQVIDNSTEDIGDLFTTLAAGFSSAFANTTLGLEGQTTTISDLVYPANGTGGLLDKDDDDATPKLYLNLLYFDKNMNFITGDYARTSSASSFEELNLEVLIPMEGYILIYVSNEEERANIAYFDDISIEHNHSPVIQEESYYPFGFSQSVGYQRESSKGQRFKYQSKEEIAGLGLGTYDFHARMYDATLGRTFQMDPLADNFLDVSPYSWVMNNPMINVDPTGMSSVTLTGKDARDYGRSLKNLYGGGSSDNGESSNGGCGENGEPCPDRQEQGDNLMPEGSLSYKDVTPNPRGERSSSESTNESISAENEPSPYSYGNKLGITGNVTPINGYVLEIGVIWDSDKNWSFYFTHGETVGVDASIGIEAGKILGIKPKNGFNVNQYSGFSGSHNAAVLFYDIGYAGDNFVKKHQGRFGKTYTETLGGGSFGLPAGYTRQFTKTILFGGNIE